MALAGRVPFRWLRKKPARILEKPADRFFSTFQTLSLFFQRGKKIRVAPVENWFQMPDELSPLKAKRTDGFVTGSRQIEPSAPQRRIEASHPC
jgi:hypothetical protein